MRCPFSHSLLRILYFCFILKRAFLFLIVANIFWILGTAVRKSWLKQVNHFQKFRSHDLFLPSIIPLPTIFAWIMFSRNLWLLVVSTNYLSFAVLSLHLLVSPSRIFSVFLFEFVVQMPLVLQYLYFWTHSICSLWICRFTLFIFFFDTINLVFFMLSGR